MWMLWNNRNNCFHRLSCKIPVEIASNATRMLDVSLQEASLTEFTCQRRPMRWTTPSADRVKLNVDAAFCPRSRIAGLGMVVRNSSGDICLCAVMKSDKMESPLQAELKAIAFGLEIAMENSFPSISVESDSLMAIKEIMKNHDSSCHCGEHCFGHS